MGYAVADVRTIIRQSARNALSSSVYLDAQIDLSFQIGADEWNRITKGARALATLPLTPGSSVLPAIPVDCTPQRILQVFLLLAGEIIDPEFTFASYEEIQKDARDSRGYLEPGLASGRPRKMAFLDGGTTGIVWPTPTQAYTIELWYAQPFTSWTAGGTPSPNSFNLPDEQLRVIARFGAPGYLQLNEKTNHAIAQGNLDEFRAQAKAFAKQGYGGRGGQVSDRSTDHDGRR